MARNALDGRSLPSLTEANSSGPPLQRRLPPVRRTSPSSLAIRRRPRHLRHRKDHYRKDRHLPLLTADLWDTVCTGVLTDLDFPDPDVSVAAVSILAAIPSYRISKLITDAHKEINSCFDSPSDNLRFSITETLGCILARDNLVTLCENNVNLLRSTSVIIKANSSSKLSLMDPASRPAVVINNGSGRLCSNM